MFNRLMNYGEIDSRPNVILTRELIKKHMPKYKRYDDMIVIEESHWEEFKSSLPLPVYKDRNCPNSVDEDELAFLVCRSVNEPYCRRLAIDKNFQNNDFRTPNMELILGDDVLICQTENKIRYEFDITTTILSFGNLNEKTRMGKLNCSNEFVVDLFASIGYYTLPLILHASAAHVYTCEQDPEALKYLKRNLKINQVDPQRFTVIEGDIRLNKPVGLAHRIILGHLPSSFDWLSTAYECIDKNLGAILHCHDLVECKPLPASSPSSSADVSMATASSGVAGDESMSMSIAASEDADVAPKGNGIDKATVEQQNQEKSEPTGEETKQNEESATSDVQNPVQCSSPKSNDDLQSIDSPPVLLEYPTEEQQANISFTNESSINESSTSVVVDKEELSIDDSLEASDHEMSAYKIRGSQFVDYLNNLANERQDFNMCVKLMEIHVVRKYNPYKYHVVFDIRVKPDGANSTNSSTDKVGVD